MTEQELAKAMLENDRRFRLLADFTPLILCETDSGFNCLYVNPAWCQLSGLTAEASKGAGWWQAVKSEDRDPLRKRFQENAASTTPWGVEYRLTSPDGKVCWLSGTVVTVRDDQGRVTGYFSVSSDITDRKRAEESLRESETRFRTLIETTPVAISIQRQGVMIYQNAACLQMFRIPKDQELAGRPAIDYVAPEHRQEIQERVRRRSQGLPVPMVYETVGLRHDGSQFPVQVAVAQVKQEGELLSVAFFTDISDRKRAEEEARLRMKELLHKEQLATIGTLVAGVAHEINNPTHVITMNSSVLEDVLNDLIPLLDKLSEERGDFMVGNTPYQKLRPHLLRITEGFDAASQRIANIVAALKEFATPGDTLRSPESVDVNESVRKSLDLLAATIRKNTHHFSVTYGDHMPKLPLGRPKQIEQVVINLILNALQALSGQDKGVWVTTCYDSVADCLIITVEDEGHGIPSEILPQIRDPFFTTKRGKGGTGLGLSIADSIVREHGGRLEFSSREGVGTMVRIILPLCPSLEIPKPT